MASKRQQQESFRKRRNNFIRRGHEISTRYSVNVWICIQKNGQFYIYNSKTMEETNWPPSQEQLKSVFPVPIVKTPKDFKTQVQRHVRKPAVPHQRILTRATPATLPKTLPRPPLPDYAGHKDTFSGRLLERCS